MAVIKRGKKWYITYYIKENGKRKLRMEVAGPRRDLAELKLKEYQELIRQGIDPRVGKEEADVNAPLGMDVLGISSTEVFTLAQFVPIFLELHGKLLSKSMQVSYRTSVMSSI